MEFFAKLIKAIIEALMTPRKPELVSNDIKEELVSNGVIEEKEEVPVKEYISLDDWITSSGRFPERASSDELTSEVIENAKDLIKKVNSLLNEIGWSEGVSISSGFRPSGANAAAGGAKKSSHMTGDALDIMQSKPGNKLGEMIRKAQDNQGVKGILGRHGLMMEHLDATVGKNTNWVHLDTKKRSKRPSMEFKP